MYQKFVLGWGTQYYGGPASTVLMEAAVPVWPQERCVRSLIQQIPDTTICAGAYEGGRDACQVKYDDLFTVAKCRKQSLIFNG